MSTVIHIPSTLRHECGGACQLQADGGTVREVLEWLKQHHMLVYRSVCDETGAVRRHVNLFVNDDCLNKTTALEVRLGDGDELSIMPAVSGG